MTDEALVLAATATSVEFGSGGYYASQGSCGVFPPATGFPLLSALDAGTVQLTGPSGALNLGAGGGSYVGQLPSGSLTVSPGTYTFTGSGGKDIGAFEIAINVQSPFSLTGASALASITRSQGATVLWSGGFPNGDVMVEGVGASTNGSVNFYCHAPSSAGQLTIPAATLLALPPGGGKLMITNATAAQTVSASGLDFGLATGVVSFEVPTTFK